MEAQLRNTSILFDKNKNKRSLHLMYFNLVATLIIFQLGMVDHQNIKANDKCILFVGTLNIRKDNSQQYNQTPTPHPLLFLKTNFFFFWISNKFYWHKKRNTLAHKECTRGQQSSIKITRIKEIKKSKEWLVSHSSQPIQ